MIRQAATLLVVSVAMTLAGCSDDPDDAAPALDSSAVTASTGSSTSAAPTDPASRPGLPDREPDVVGVAGTAVEHPLYLKESSDDYYLGMSLLQGDPVIRDRGGHAMAASEINEDDGVAVWIGSGCAESYPVQCSIVALEVERSAP